MTFVRKLRRALGLGLPSALLSSLLAVGGCGPVEYSATATVDTPRMVAIDSGVWVVENRPQPVFFVDGTYWRYEGGVWYRSTYLGGWSRVQVSVVPPRIRRIDRPVRYRRYRAPARARVRTVPPGHVRRARRRHRRAVRRDRRQHRREVRRDRRQDRREMRRERRQDRRERRHERREDRRERRQDRREMRRDRRQDRRERRHERRQDRRERRRDRRGPRVRGPR